MTDVDDKILQRASETGVSPAVLARKYEASFLSDMKLLGIRGDFEIVRVTEHIQEIIECIQVIMSNGCAYSTSGGDVYFDTLKFEELSGENYPRMSTATEQANPETSVSTEKKRFQDFALWKSAKETDSVSWKSPWGSGRPGWHIECSAMIRKIFGHQ